MMRHYINKKWVDRQRNKAVINFSQALNPAELIISAEPSDLR